MTLIKDRILIFKSDRIGDLINFSPCLKTIRDNNMGSNITLVCSEYNYQIAKSYNFIDELIIYDKKNILFTLIINFKKFFLTKYKHLFQFDGRTLSYSISFFVRASVKSTICFIKHKKFFGIEYQVLRPGKFLLNLFFSNYIYCDEKYSNIHNNKSEVHYQTLYFEILKKLKFNIQSKKNLFLLDSKFKDIYESFFFNHINDKFYLFHFDEKWNRCKPIDYENTIKIIDKISTKTKLIITTGLKDFVFLDTLEQKFKTYNYENNKFYLVNKKNENNSVLILKNLPLNLLAFFIGNSEKNISFHSGPIIHISPAFDKEILDIIPRNKNDELDRWIPVISNYKRINFEDLNNDFLNKFII